MVDDRPVEYVEEPNRFWTEERKQGMAKQIIVGSISFSVMNVLVNPAIERLAGPYKREAMIGTGLLLFVTPEQTTSIWGLGTIMSEIYDIYLEAIHEAGSHINGVDIDVENI